MSISLYCNCFPKHYNRHTQQNQKNLICGSASIPQDYKLDLHNRNFIFDDTNDNISHLNKWLGDLTGLYWVWKNTDDEFVGTNQYRRFWNDQELNNLQLNENTIYISEPVVFEMSTYDQYVHYCGDMALKILRGAAESKSIDMPPQIVDGLHNTNILSSCNMFFAHRKVFDKLCSILFQIVFELYEGTKYALPYIQYPNQTRLIAFLAERVLHLIYMHKDYYFGNIEIKPIKWSVY